MGNISERVGTGRAAWEAIEPRLLLSASITGAIWNDANADGVRGVGEILLAGAAVELFCAGADGQIAGGNDGQFAGADDYSVASAVIGPDGTYAFADLPAGQYYLQFRSPSGYACSPGGLDSDADALTGLTGVFALADGASTTRDAGMTGAAHGFGWADVMGDYTTFSESSARVVATDAAGNRYVAGTLSGTVDLGTDWANSCVLSGNSRAFLAKYDSAGHALWARSFYGTWNNAVTSLAVGADGSVYAAGWFTGTIDFNPGTGTATLTVAGMDQSVSDAFVVKLDAAGNCVWAMKIGSYDVDAPAGMGLDAAGNVYVAGTFRQTVDFDPGAGTANLASAGGTDVFIAKYSAGGAFGWVKRLSSSSDESATGFSVGADGNLYTVGACSSNTDFDPGAGVQRMTGNPRAFISRLDGDGNFGWVRGFELPTRVTITAVAAGADGAVCTAGFFTNTVDFDPGTGTANLTSNAASNDVFVAKLDAAGAFLWARAMGGSGADQANALVVATDGSVYSAGIYTGAVDFDPGAGTFTLPATGRAFISKLDTSGNFAWAAGLVCPYAYGDAAYGLALSGGTVLAAGEFLETIDLDPGAGTANFVSGNDDYAGFLVALDALGNYQGGAMIGGPSDEASDTAVGPAIDAAGNLYVAGTFYGTDDFDPGPGAFRLVCPADTAGAFVAKYTAAGALVWARAFVGDNYVRGHAIAVTPDGQVYIAGVVAGVADFDPGPGACLQGQETGPQSIYLSRLDARGHFLGAVWLPGVRSLQAVRMAMGPSGEIYLSDRVDGTIDLDPGPATASLTAENATFLARYDASLNYVWGRAFGTGGYSFPYELTVDPGGNVCVGGYLGDTCDFDPGEGVASLAGTAAGEYDLFLASFDGTGQFRWAGALAGATSSKLYGLTADPAGNVYAVGDFKGTVDLDPGPGTAAFTTNDPTYADAFILKLDSAGHCTWAKTVAGPGPGGRTARGVALDAGGYVYVAGAFGGQTDFDPGPGTAVVAPTGGVDGYVLKLTADGAYVCARQALGAYGSGNYPVGIVIDPAGNPVVGGTVSGGHIDFDPGDGVYIPPAFYGQLYLWRLASRGVGGTIWTDTDRDGVRDAGETGASGASVKVYADDGDGLFEPGDGDSLAATVATDATGQFLAESLPAGRVWVTTDRAAGPLRGAQLTAGSDPQAVLLAIAGQHVDVTMGYAPNRAPAARAGGPYAIAEGASLNLSAAASSDADGDAITYAWDVNGDGIFTDASGVSPAISWAQLAAMGIDDGLTQFVVRVRANDGMGHTVTSPIVILTIYTVAGDANLDGTVNLEDFGVLKDHFGTAGADWTTADFNGDALVNLEDFGILKDHFGLTVPLAADRVVQGAVRPPQPDGDADNAPVRIDPADLLLTPALTLAV